MRDTFAVVAHLITGGGKRDPSQITGDGQAAAAAAATAAGIWLLTALIQ